MQKPTKAPRHEKQTYAFYRFADNNLYPSEGEETPKGRGHHRTIQQNETKLTRKKSKNI